jgi:hypothetical protein
MVLQAAISLLVVIWLLGTLAIVNPDGSPWMTDDRRQRKTQISTLI